MEDNNSYLGGPLPLAALRLLVPPIRLVSAAIWRTVQQKVVADYGMLEEFVSMVTDIVPELLTTRQKAQLLLGLRARLILELCQCEATAGWELLQPHLDRVQTLSQAWAVEAGVANMEGPHSKFVDLVYNLLTNPDERGRFFQANTETTTEHQTSEITVDATNWTPGGKGTKVLLEDTTRNEENVGLVQSQVEDAPRLLKQCRVQLKRLDTPLSLQSRPVRQNRGLRMKSILLEEKRSLCEDAYKSASRKTQPSNRAPLHVSDHEESSSLSKDEDLCTAPINICSEDNSWSYYSDDDSCHKTTSSSLSTSDSWSNYSDESSFVTPASSSTEGDLLSNGGPSFISPKDVSATRRKPGISNIKASTPKKHRDVQCFICRKQVNTSLRAHMETHFPTGDYACPRCDARFKLFSSFKLHLNRTCFEYSQQHVDPQKPDEAMNLNKCDKCQEAF
ncbi:hypothetical protein FQN60_015317, partial [Etheostoma spectabile]